MTNDPSDQSFKKSELESTPNKSSSDVVVMYHRGLPNLICPLPSRNEKCQFILRPVSQNVGDFLNMLREEDRGIDRAAILNKDGVRIASSCTIENLMDEKFWLHLNDKHYLVEPPEREKVSPEEINRLGDIKALVSKLYEELHVGEHQIRKERQLHERLEELNVRLIPLEKKRMVLDMKATKRSNTLTWVGLGLMSVQFGVLARLTWWEYSWDIMEPVTYFVTYGTAMAAYAYFVLTKQEYLLPDVKDRQHLITMHKNAKKVGINLNEYNDIKREIAEIEYDLRRLNDPLHKDMSLSPPKHSTYSDSELAAAKKLKAIFAENSLIGDQRSGLEKFTNMIESATRKLKKE